MTHFFAIMCAQAAEIQARLDAQKKKMSMPAYDKTPDEIKAADAERISKAEAELVANTQHIADFKQLLVST